MGLSGAGKEYKFQELFFAGGGGRRIEEIIMMEGQL
jgi:hypothetical protein